VGSYQDFAKFVSTTKSELNPQHSHMRIQTDGTIASAYFDFVFMIDCGWPRRPPAPGAIWTGWY
jgi:hypothetical protein